MQVKVINQGKVDKLVHVLLRVDQLTSAGVPPHVLYERHPTSSIFLLPDVLMR